MPNNQQMTAKVVLLSTNQKSNLFIGEKYNKLYFDYNSDREFKTYQYLYLISDQEIKEGDWVYDTTEDVPEGSKIIEKATHDSYLNPKAGYKKIIATTNPKLHTYYHRGDTHNDIPKISINFIKKYIEMYNSGKPIVDVWLDTIKGKYHTGVVDCGADDWWDSGYHDPDTIKVNESNEVSIHPIKDQFSRDEVLQILIQAFNHYYDNRVINTKEWFNENY